MEGTAKIKLPYCLLSNAYANRFWKDSRLGLEAIWASDGRSEATSGAAVLKYAF